MSSLISWGVVYKARPTVECTGGMIEDACGHYSHSLSLTYKLQDHNMDEDKCETRLYVGNLDLRITESHLINMFSPFGKIVAEDFLWHTRGPKRGEPRGFAFIQFSTKEEAKLAKERMNGRLAFGRPLVVRLAAEKYLIEAANPPQAVGDSGKSTVTSGSSGQMSRSAKITAIKNKLKALEEESSSSKRPRQSDHAS
ncbi:hypothetical protein ACLOJK_021969 [Asimina triloba]